jgi:PEP-CTERM motif
MRTLLLRRMCVVGATALIVAGVAADALAEPVSLSGSITVNMHEGPVFVLNGPGFTLAGANDFTALGPEGLDFYAFCGRDPVGCRPGEQLQMSGATSGELFIGPSTLMLGGITHSAQAFLTGRFDAPSRTVPSPSRVAMLEAPFTFNGTLRVAGAGGENLLLTAATGSGTATARLFWSGDPVFGFADENDRITYSFDSAAAPVPEPASVILLGSGLVATLARRRRQSCH